MTMMSAGGGGGSKRPAKRKSSPPVTDVQSTGGYKPAIKRPAKPARKQPPTRAPVTDVQSSGGDYGTKRANAYKKTKAYQLDLKAGRTSPRTRTEYVRDITTGKRKAVEVTYHPLDHPKVFNLGHFLNQLDQIQSHFSGQHFNPSNRTIQENAFGGAPTFQGRVIADTAKAYASDPIGNTAKLAKSVGEEIVGAPAGVYELVRHPSKTFTAIIDDYKRRYGDLWNGNEAAFMARLHKEGVAPELFDITALAGGEIGQADRALNTAARAGRFGDKVKSIAESERPGIRLSGGTVKAQPKSERLTGNLVQRGVDSLRQKVQDKRVANKDVKPVGPHIEEAANAGNLTYVDTPTLHPLGKKTTRAQHRLPARDKGISLAQMKVEHQAEIHKGATAALKSLSKDERKGFKYAMQLGIHNADAARKTLADRIKAIEAERAAHPDIPVGKSDELPVLRKLIGNAEKTFTPKLKAVVAQERSRAKRLGHADPGLTADTAEARRYVAQAQHLEQKGLLPKLGPEETINEYVHRVGIPAIRDAAQKDGLGAPGYFPSQERTGLTFSPFTVGGVKAVKGPKQYTGALYRTGREVNDPQAYVTALAQNIKRKHNWNLVADNFDKHAFAWSKGEKSGMTLKDIQREVEARGIDPKQIAYWNPGKYRESQVIHTGSDATIADATHGGEFDRAIHHAVSEATVEGTDATRLAKYKTQRGWVAIPREVYDEIHTDTKPSGAVGRSFDILKGKASRVLLANPAWLQFQVASNALLTGFVGGVGPVTAVKAATWWHKLDQAQKDAIEPYVGIHPWYDEQTKLGSTAAKNRLVNAYRAFKETPFYAKAHKANPFDLLFKADNAQNNAFRRAVLYNEVKKDTYRRMGQDATLIQKLQARIAGTGKADPGHMVTFATDPKLIERYAQAVNDLLGNWTTYTSRERKIFARSVMFYGFLRYSLNLTFNVLPLQHPLRSAIALQLGQIHDDEVRKLFGGNVPTWALANSYEHGGATKIPLSRLNPLFNASSYLAGGVPNARTGFAFLPPAIQIPLNAATGENLATGAPFTHNGKAQQVGPGKGETFGDFLQSLIGQTANLSPYYRMAEKTGIHVGPVDIKPILGKQSSDSSLFFPNPMHYVNRGAGIASNEANQKVIDALKKEGAGQRLLDQLIPLVGQNAASDVKSIRNAQAKGQKKKSKVAPLGGFSPSDMKDLKDAAGGGLSQQDIKDLKDAMKGG